LRVEPGLAGFVLIGGSALSLHLAHRQSEDLDFAYLGLAATPASRLPRGPLEQVLKHLRGEGHQIEERDSPVSWREFETAGMDLHDYQQDYSIGGVLVSFFTPDYPLTRLIAPGTAGGVRLAGLDELFRSKALVVAGRSKTRDWFDLHYLLTVGGYTMADFAYVFQLAGEPQKLGIAISRLCSGQPGLGDEGFAGLTPHPPDVEEMKRFFVRECNRLEIELG
jgi:hypothetical protein